MAGYIVRRLLSSLPLLFGLLTLTFFLVHLAPGDPTAMYISGDVDPKYGAHLRTALGLDQPLPIRYVKWVAATVTGDLGVSFSKHAAVTDILATAIPNTILLTTGALFFNFLIGILIGMYSAVRRGTASDHAISIISLFLFSMPEFWLGLMLILAFSLYFPILPASGLHSPLASYLAPLDYIVDTLKHMVMPVFVLGVASAAATGRYMRGSLLEVINQDYIRTARAKGLSEARVIGVHAMRNALIPIITLLGLSFPFLLGGAVIVETVFGWPGMGKLAVDAIFARDYPLIIACTMVSGTLVILGNLLSDVMYAFVDPRIRY